MTKHTQVSSMSLLLDDRNRVWWYGIFLVNVGLLLWIVAIAEPLLLPVLNLLSVNDLTVMGEVGFLSFQFALGFGSSSVIGWGFAVTAASRTYTKQVRNYLLIGIVVWYVLDGIASFISQFYLNIASNTMFLLSALYVLYTTKLVEED